MIDFVTLGYVPSSFPRDPIKINQAMEHLCLAQCLEPLVTLDNENNPVKAVASHWIISNDRKTIDFVIDERKRFHNGDSIRAKDVAYSINRHRMTDDSQSHQFLKNIESINILGERKLSIRLRRPQFSILKALSRPQLGIVPEGWEYGENLDSPFICSGKYILVRRESNWYLTLRHDFEDVTPNGIIKTWKIISGAPTDHEISSQPIPDYIPLARASLIEKILNDSRCTRATYRIEESFTLGQTAALWLPNGNNFGDFAHQKLSMGAMRELFERRRLKLNFKTSTGVVPSGVTGHIPKSIKFVDPPAAERLKTVKILMSESNFKDIFETDDREFVEKKYNIQFEFVIEGSKPKEGSELINPDLYVVTWLGGFADPDGFLPVLTSMLKINFSDYLGSTLSIYEKASEECEMSDRDKLFQKFNASLISSQKFVPAWQLSISSVTHKRLKTERHLARYTPDLASVRLQT